MIKKRIKNIVNRFITKCVMESSKFTGEHNRLINKGALINNKTFSEFKNFCSGKKVVICGAGPSLNRYKPIKGAIHIALNRAIVFDKVHFDFLFVQDFRGITHNKLEPYVKNYSNCIKFFEQEGYFRHKTNTCCSESFINSCKDARPYYSDYLVNSNGTDFYPTDIKFRKDINFELLGAFPYVGLTVLQFALFLNPSDIYLVGYDGNGSHFSFINLTKEETAKEIESGENNDFGKSVDNTFHFWLNFKDFAANYYPDTTIHSINPVKLEKMFDDIYQK